MLNSPPAQQPPMLCVVVFIGRDNVLHVATCYNSEREATTAALTLMQNHGLQTGTQVLTFSAN